MEKHAEGIIVVMQTVILIVFTASRKLNFLVDYLTRRSSFFFKKRRLVVKFDFFDETRLTPKRDPEKLSVLIILLLKSKSNNFL